MLSQLSHRIHERYRLRIPPLTIRSVTFADDTHTAHKRHRVPPTVARRRGERDTPHTIQAEPVCQKPKSCGPQPKLYLIKSTHS